MSYLAGCDIGWINATFAQLNSSVLQNNTATKYVQLDAPTPDLQYVADLGQGWNLSSWSAMPYRTTLELLSNASCSSIYIGTKSPPIYPWVFSFPRMLLETDATECLVELLTNRSGSLVRLEWKRAKSLNYSDCNPTVEIDSLGNVVSKSSALTHVLSVTAVLITASLLT
ncbi:hypothetical protein HDU82_009090 [Entophlyctis luteolus]|nr:hypothetical protein HDU82_009090 [Entophlyctis luteolus]